MTNKLEGSGRSGDFVLTTQPLAKAEGFSHVSRPWYETTMSIDRGIDIVADHREGRDDFVSPLGSIRPAIHDARFCLEHASGRRLYPDRHAMGQFSTICEVPSQYPLKLQRRNAHGDSEAIVYALEHSLKLQNPRRRFIFRGRKEGKLQAVLPESYVTIRNDWYLRVLRLAIPGGRLSHWRGDGDTLFTNLLIPDSIQQEPDSDYGAMLSLSNCELGKRPFGQFPSLFRAICMNGCIWDRTVGSQLTVALTRRRDLRLDELEKAIIANVHEQIPLAVKAIDRLLATRGFATDVSMKVVIAQVAKDFRLSKPRASAVLRAWWAESSQTSDTKNTLFAIINGVTRAGQALDNTSWVAFDVLGGELARFKPARWEDLVTRAAKLSAKDVERSYQPWALAN